jgi:hypothetical protein
VEGHISYRGDAPFGYGTGKYGRGPISSELVVAAVGPWGPLAVMTALVVLTLIGSLYHSTCGIS